MKRFKLSLGIVALFIALGSAIAATVPQQAKSGTLYFYHDPSTDIVDLTDPQKWDEVPADCEVAGNTPCAIRYEGERAAFDAYIQSFTSVTAMTIVSELKKN